MKWNENCHQSDIFSSRSGASQQKAIQHDTWEDMAKITAENVRHPDNRAIDISFRVALNNSSKRRRNILSLYWVSFGKSANGTFLISHSPCWRDHLWNRWMYMVFTNWPMQRVGAPRTGENSSLLLWRPSGSTYIIGSLWKNSGGWF